MIPKSLKRCYELIKQLDYFGITICTDHCYMIVHTYMRLGDSDIIKIHIGLTVNSVSDVIYINVNKNNITYDFPREIPDEILDELLIRTI